LGDFGFGTFCTNKPPYYRPNLPSPLDFSPNRPFRHLRYRRAGLLCVTAPAESAEGRRGGGLRRPSGRHNRLIAYDSPPCLSNLPDLSYHPTNSPISLRLDPPSSTLRDAVRRRATQPVGAIDVMVRRRGRCAHSRARGTPLRLRSRS